ncbi:MAG: hypothetical protein LUD52_00180 [Opitutae bacterium]|nr:hypothetical protein [Opitutae bacterium]
MSPSKLLLSTLVAAAATVSAASVFADDDETTVQSKSEAYQRGDHATGDNAWSFNYLDFSSFFGSSDLVLSADGTSNGTSISAANNIYFSGSGEKTSSVTITGANIDTSGLSYSSYGNATTYYSFIVEGSTVTFSGGDVSELGLNLSIGTMADATLAITNGATVATTAYYSVVGSNQSTGTIEVSGSGSELYTQQITLGVAASSLGEDTANLGDGYYDARYLQSESDYNATISAATSTEDSKIGYGIIDVSEGGKVYIGTGNTTENSSQTKLQLSNGSISVDGADAALYVGGGAGVILGSQILINGSDGNPSVVSVSQSITVSNGGLFTNVQKSGESTSLGVLMIGETTYGSTTTTSIEVKDSGSSFDLNVGGDGAIIGYSDTYGGSADISITASAGGSFSLTSSNGLYVARDDSGKGSGFSVSLAATDGGSINLSQTATTTSLFFGKGTTAGTSNISVSSTGSGSNVTISSAYSIYANGGEVSLIEGQTAGTDTVGDDNVYVTFSVEDGGSMSLSSQYYTGTTNSPGIEFAKNTVVTVSGEGSELYTEADRVVVGGSEGHVVSIKISDGGLWTANGVLFEGSGGHAIYNAERKTPRFYLWAYSSLEISGGGRLVVSAYDDSDPWDVDTNPTGVIVEEGGLFSINGGASLGIDIAAVASSDNEAAISAGSVEISDSAEVSIAIDVAALLSEDLEEGAEFTVNLIEYTQGSLEGTISDDAVSIYGDSQSNWTVSVVAGDTMLYVDLTYIPEPSMVGILAGLAALGLVATRRRRNRGNKA